MRRNAVIVQQATGAYQALLQRALPHHLAYAEAHGFDYWPLFGEMRPTPWRHPYWEKAYLIRQAMRAGYAEIVAMDSDTLIVGQEDVRLAVPAEGVGAVWHARDDWNDKDAYDHYNVGVLYVRNGARAQDFVAEWIDQGDNAHPWHDQHAFNAVAGLSRYAGLVQQIPRRWHSTPPHFAAATEDTQVMAWHGGGSVEARLQAMDRCFRERGL